MKSILTVLMAIPVFAFAQQPFGYHATWYFEYNEAAIQGVDSLYHAKDSVIQGETWQFFKRGAAGFTYLFQTQNDSVFYWANGEKQLMYDFSAAVGDSWHFTEWDTSSSCLDTPRASVLAIGFDTVNGQALKYWLLEDEMDTNYTYGFPRYMCSSGYCLGGKLYEHVGRWDLPINLQTFLIPEQNLCDGTVLKSSTVFSYSLRCYNDDNTFISFTNKGCTWWSGPGFEEQNTSSFAVYPNPTSGQVYIKAEKSIAQITVFDVTGNAVVNMAANPILLPEVAGLYVINVLFEDGSQEVKKVVRQ